MNEIGEDMNYYKLSRWWHLAKLYITALKCFSPVCEPPGKYGNRNLLCTFPDPILPWHEKQREGHHGK